MPSKQDREVFISEMKDKVVANGDIIAVPMGDLRRGFGYGRLGPHVGRDISRGLRSAGLDHSPDPLPSDQFATVYVHKQGTGVADVMNAVVNPSVGGAATISSLSGGAASETLQRIKALVCEE